MTTTDTPMTTQHWTYEGRAVLKGQKLGYAFRRPDGERALFDAAPSGAVIGGRYAIEASEAGDVARPGSAKFDGMAELDDDEVARLRFDDRAAMATVDQARAERRMAKENGDYGDLTLRQVRDLLATGPWSLRAGRLAAVLKYLGA